MAASILKGPNVKRSMWALLGCLTLVAAACGGAEASENVASLDDSSGLVLATSEGEGMTEEEAFLAFTACMREEGIDLPDPEVDADGNVQLTFREAAGASGIDRDALQDGFEACGELIEGFTQGFRRADDTGLADQLLEFAQCLRDQGIHVDDPDLTFTPGEGGQAGGPFGDLDLDDPEFQAAAEACQDLLPNGRGGPGPGDRQQTGASGGDGDA